MIEPYVAIHSDFVTTTTETTNHGTDVDVLLMCRLHAGDQRAGLRLLDRHMRAIRRYFVNKTRRAGDVDVLVGGVVRAMLGPNAGFRNATRFMGHLFAVQQSVLRGYFGLRRGEATRCTAAELGAAEPTWREATVVCQQLLVALRGLPIPQQEVLELLYWEDLPIAALAEILELPIPLVGSRVRAARAALLASLGVHPDDEDADTMRAAVDGWGREIGERLQTGRPQPR